MFLPPESKNFHRATPVFSRLFRRILPVVRLIFLACFAVAGSGPVMAQVDGFNLWQEVTEQQAAGRLPAALKTAARRDIVPQVYRTLVLDKSSMAQLLEAAPAESAKRSTRSGSEIILPLPQGGYGRFSVLESPLMEPALAAQFPEIKNYVIQGIDDQTATGRIDTSPKGFRAMVISASGTFFIDPFWSNSDEVSICYAKQDFANDEKMKAWSCGVQGSGSSGGPPARANRGALRSTGATLRTYRIAIAATGEYTAFHNGQMGAMAAINTSLARVNTVYERDFCTRMVLVANNLSLVFTDAATDPYTNDDVGAMLDENQATIDSIIGDANYDIGHVFGAGSDSGVAFLGVVCVTGEKAGGVTSSSKPVGDPFDVDYVAHEIGHQFAANHTFNALANIQWNPSTAFEPGSGSTIMAYAGIVSGQNLQRYSDDHFHTGSFTEIESFITTGAGAGAFSNIPTGNSAPVIAAMTGYTIPARTPFALTASATDADGDPLTYCWEQYDVGPKQNPVTANPRDNGSSPIFRSYSPTTNTTRFFPSLPYILNNANIPPATYSSNNATWATGETLPTTSRTMTFRVSVRDNRAGGGGQNWASTQVTTISNAGPFRISSLNTAGSIVVPGTPFNLTWDVAGTAAAPIGTANVRITFSTDGGTNFPVVLAASVPNNGSASVTIPAGTDTSVGRLKVEAVDNIFFDINDVNLTVRDITAPLVRIVSPPPNAKYPPGRTIKVVVTATDLNNALQPGKIGQVELSVNGAPLGIDKVAPYEFYYTPPGLGAITLQARATDTEGKTGVSSPLQITIAYLQPGELDYSFVGPLSDDHIQALAADTQGRIYIGGLFTKLDGANAPRVARLKSDGAVDPSFFAGAGPNAEVRALLHVPQDSGLYVGGDFGLFAGSARSALVRLRIGQPGFVDGSLDPAFDPVFEGADPSSPPYIRAIVRQDDGKLLVGGSFGAVDGVSRDNLVRLNPDGSLDTGFTPDPNGAVYCLALQPDGKILVGGSFGFVAGQETGRIARLNRDGTRDSTFYTGAGNTCGFDGPVNGIAVTLDGDVVAGGQFGRYGARPYHYNLAKLGSDGTVDAMFNFAPGLNAGVNDVHARPSGEILATGQFTEVAHSSLPIAPTAVGRVIQFETSGPDNGTLDARFNPGGAGADGAVLDSIVLPGGDILIAGSFKNYNGVARDRLAVIAGFDQSAPAIVSAPSFNIDAGRDLDFGFASAGGGGVSYRLTGPLPRGVEFDPATGRLRGLPLDAGRYEFEVVADASGRASPPTRFVLNVNSAKVSYNQWSKAWFSPAELARAEESGPAAVRNHAGLSNYLVYALGGGDPDTADQLLQPVVRREKIGTRQYLTLTAKKYPGSDASYSAELSRDLVSWGSTASGDVRVLIDDSSTLKVRAAVHSAAENSQFLRLKVFAP